MIKFVAPIRPVPFKRVESHGRRRFNNERYREFKAELGWHGRLAMGGSKPLRGAIKLHVEISRPLKPTALKFGDADNHLKAVLDALNGICYVDDRQIVEATVELVRGDDGVTVELEELQ